MKAWFMNCGCVFFYTCQCPMFVWPNMADHADYMCTLPNDRLTILDPSVLNYSVDFKGPIMATFKIYMTSH